MMSMPAALEALYASVVTSNARATAMVPNRWPATVAKRTMLAAMRVSCALRATQTAQHQTMTSKSAVPVLASKVTMMGERASRKGRSRILQAVQNKAKVKRCSMRRFWRSREMMTTIKRTKIEAGCKCASDPMKPLRR